MKAKGEVTRKRILLNHARKMAKLKKRFRDIRRRKNKARNGKNKAQQITERINRQFEGYKKIVAPEDVLCELIKLLTSATKVTIKYLLDDDIGCSCGALKYLPVDKIYVEKDGETYVLKYSFPDATKLLDDHRISTKLVVNNS